MSKADYDLIESILGDEVWGLGEWSNGYWRSNHINSVCVMAVESKLEIVWSTLSGGDRDRSFELGDPELVAKVRGCVKAMMSRSEEILDG
jgi:hypothetical protein